ncbi:unnamed protein product [Danaus chrysippus]|uniref:(African queen) hypothetical protein n=1 Tax=Danaus chrysippus TaxID=151541 RepID=A0A8J2QQ21_9NEOP|nr:unnamed protein product [Danaus chrysippus]
MRSTECGRVFVGRFVSRHEVAPLQYSCSSALLQLFNCLHEGHSTVHSPIINCSFNGHDMSLPMKSEVTTSPFDLHIILNSPPSEPLVRVATGRYAPTFLNFSTHKMPKTKVSPSASSVGGEGGGGGSLVRRVPDVCAAAATPDPPRRDAVPQCRYRAPTTSSSAFAVYVHANLEPDRDAKTLFYGTRKSLFKTERASAKKTMQQFCILQQCIFRKKQLV